MLAAKEIGVMSQKGLCCITPMPVQEGLAIEQRLLEQVASGQSRFGYSIWRSQQALVVPRSATHRQGFDLASKYCESKGWPVVVRSTGGEMTPQTSGFINLSMVVSRKGEKIGIRESYSLICQPLLHWLEALGIHAYCSSVEGAFCNGEFNLVVNGKKIAGTAQRRKRIKVQRLTGQEEDTAILLHAVILCDEGLERIWKISNEFYKACQLPPFIIGDRHICMSELTQQHGEGFIRRAMNDLDRVVEQHISMFCRADQSAVPLSF